MQQLGYNLLLLRSFCKCHTLLCYVASKVSTLYSRSAYILYYWSSYFTSASFATWYVAPNVHYCSAASKQHQPFLLRLQWATNPCITIAIIACITWRHKKTSYCRGRLEKWMSMSTQTYHTSLGTRASLNRHLMYTYFPYDITSYANHHDAVTGRRLLLLKIYQSNGSVIYNRILFLEHFPNWQVVVLPTGCMNSWWQVYGGDIRDALLPQTHNWISRTSNSTKIRVLIENIEITS